MPSYCYYNQNNVVFCNCWYEMFCEINFVNCSWPGGHGDNHKHKDITHHTDVGTISFYYVNVILY